MKITRKVKRLFWDLPCTRHVIWKWNYWLSNHGLTIEKFVVVHCSSVASHVRLFETPRTAAHQTSLTFTISWSMLRLMSIESMTPSNHLILCLTLLPPSISPSVRVFFNESVLRIRWAEYWSFSFNISPSNEYSGLISFMTEIKTWRYLNPLRREHSSDQRNLFPFFL